MMSISGLDYGKIFAHSGAPLRALAPIFNNQVFLEFQNDQYDSTNIKDTADKIRELWPEPGDFLWGLYQTILTPETSWPNSGFFKAWLASALYARNGLRKIKNAGGPPGESNLEKTLDKAYRRAFYGKNCTDSTNYGYPSIIEIGVSSQISWNKSHGLVYNWVADPTSPSGEKLQIVMICPNVDRSTPAGGWKSWTAWLNPSNCPPIEYFETTWAAPKEPVINPQHPEQLVFIFNGLMGAPSNNVTPGILQPVLQWGESPVPGAGGGPYWSVASWYVPAGQPFELLSSCPRSKRQKVNPGDSVVGKIRRWIDLTVSPATINYTSWFEINPTGTPADKKYAELTVTGIPELVGAVEAIEAYGIHNVNEYTKDKDIKATNIKLLSMKDGVGPLAPPPNFRWYKQTPYDFQIATDDSADGGYVTFSK